MIVEILVWGYAITQALNFVMYYPVIKAIVNSPTADAINVPACFWYFSTGAVAAVAGNIGIGLMLTGVAQMLSPVPKPPGIGDAPTQLESNSFSGVLNTVRQGVPVPIAYGRVFVGSAVVSAGLDVDQV